MCKDSLNTNKNYFNFRAKLLLAAWRQPGNLISIQAYFPAVKIFTASEMKPCFWETVYYMQYTASALSCVSSTSYLFVSETE